MKNKEKEIHVSWLKNLLQNFQETTKKGKETNSNEERARAISEIEEITGKLETYIRNNEDLLEVITGSSIELAREVNWNDVVRPTHFEEDLQEMLSTLKEK
ncbi:hypothetical protein GCM10007103_06410 [Salinimicrobium marinum]|uniref:Uncharacterized protein n=1 Tax=Salinimicrobium marinum TaxID=680283 RepID=A0A918S7G2_9FLAO|nr:hypothetical protein [Salinimicrobium marinum]GHA27700.1 hypothetical protein GCM10007103_06410 [Salinimicrobium marinum]